MSSDDEVYRFVHRTDHLRSRKGHGFAEQCLVMECWGYPIVDVPQWAIDLADSGAPGSQWCPVISPELLDR